MGSKFHLYRIAYLAYLSSLRIDVFMYRVESRYRRGTTNRRAGLTTCAVVIRGGQSLTPTGPHQLILVATGTSHIAENVGSVTFTGL